MMMGLCLIFSQASATDWGQFAKVVFGVGGALVATAGAIAGVNWWLTPTDEEYCRQLNSEISHIAITHEKLINLCKSTFGWTIYSSDLRQRLMSSFSETFLFEVASENYKLHSVTFPVHIVEHCHFLEKNLTELFRRIDVLNKYYSLDALQRKNLSSIQTLVRLISRLSEELELVKDYLMLHQAYFALSENCYKAQEGYKKEIDWVGMYSSDLYGLGQRLDACVYAKYTGYRYPYVSYVMNLYDVIDRLMNFRINISYNYQYLINWTDDFVSKLKLITVALDSRYRAQLVQKERDEIEQERIKLEKKRAELQAARVRLVAETEIARWEAQRIEIERNLLQLQSKLNTAVESDKGLQLNIAVNI